MYFTIPSFITTCVLGPFAIVTNVLILVDAFRKNIREIPSMNYLIVLGFADLIFMVSQLISESLHYFESWPDGISCTLLMGVLPGWGQIVSIYTIIAISADGLYMVDSPLKAPQNMTRKKVIIITTTYSVLLFLPQIESFWICAVSMLGAQQTLYK